MYALNYSRPNDLHEAQRKAQAGGRLLAGGQTLLPSLKLRLTSADELIDLSAIGALSGIQREGNALTIGAMTRHAEVAKSPEVTQILPALADLASHIGDRQIRTMGTLGGSVANNDPAACYPSAVLALGATIITSQRRLLADQFFTGMFATALEDGEIITAISFPIPKRAAYAKFVQPASRFALLGVFVAQFETGVRVAITGGKSCVYRHAEMEAALNQEFSAAAAQKVAVSPADLNADLHGSAAYRAQLISVQTQRAVLMALGQR
jgi:aerobic carbon-monoxide dehydrogenase medium subunit